MTETTKCFSEIPEFREAYQCKPLLSEVLPTGLYTYLSNSQDYEDMREAPNTGQSVLTADSLDKKSIRS